MRAQRNYRELRKHRSPIGAVRPLPRIDGIERRPFLRANWAATARAKSD